MSRPGAGPAPGAGAAILAAVLSIGWGGVTPAEAADPRATAVADTAEASVRTALERYYEVLSARDWPAFEAAFWPGATIATVWAPPGEDGPSVEVMPVPEFVARAPEGPGSREIFEEWAIEVEVGVDGDLARARVRFGARFGDPGAVREWEGIDAFLLLRHDGEWRIVSLAFTGEP